MSVVTDILTSQPQFAVAIVLFLAATIFRRLGPGLLERWLGLTHETASRMSGAIVIGLWTVLLLVMVGSRAGLMDLSVVAGMAGEFLSRSWWIILLVVASLAWKLLR